MANKLQSPSPGTLVQARGRNWIVLPADEENVVRLRPVDGSDAETIGIFLPIEQDSISPSEYDWPNPEQAGNFQGGLLLRDAVRLTLRSGAGPFRSVGQLSSFVPRAYQYVPLIMALRQDPVRLLIADDVGVGKTIEAG
ncbi:MAG: helicase SNF2, partial [Chloroflexi bacterium]|nr:helicase SNF2 [Chloroflexota bacterium]